MMRLAVGLAALVLVSACGIKGDLERPDPMWNAPAAIRHDCRRQREYNETHPGHQQPLDPRCTQNDGAQPAPASDQPPQSPPQPQP
jgi:predicted small lipoprotein YifL